MTTEVIVAGSVIAGAAVGAALYYRNVVRPLRRIARGIDLLREQDFSSRLVPTGVASADRIVTMFNAMMGSLKNERLKVREQNHLLDLLVEASPSGIVMLDGNNCISMINRVAATLLDVDRHEVAGTRLESLSSDTAAALRLLADGQSTTLRLADLQIYRCSRRSFINNGYPHPFFIIEEMTGEIRQAEHSTYERIIRLIAHEVNNSVAGVNSTLETVSDFLADDTSTADMRDVIEISRNRLLGMSDFITRLSNLVKLPEPQPSPTSVASLLRNCTAMVAKTASELNITIDNRCAERTAATLNVDMPLMEQAIINILRNAIESIGCNGRVTIDFNEGTHTLTIADNGPGITPEARQQLFTPMFTTKPNGHGLGLMLTAEILRKHGCRFSLQTDATDGITRFKITFPA